MIQRLILLFLLSSNCYAGDTKLDLAYGLSAVNESPQAKIITAALSRPISDSALYQRLGVAYWFNGPPNANSLHVAYSLGTEVHSGVLYGSLYWGIGYLFGADGVRLSGELQFINNVAVGVEDKAESRGLGFNFIHVSNAGINYPNLGRDFWPMFGIWFKL